MAAKVDLSQLAVDREPEQTAHVRARRNWLTRYVLPAAFVLGFLGILVWAAWDFIFPPRPVTVVPVVALQSQGRQEGTPLFKAAGWVEPRPTPVRVPALAPGVIEKLLVVEDQPVKAGEPIAELVKADAQLAYERSRSDELLSAAQRDEACAALQAAKARLAFAQRDFQRKESLEGAVSGRAIDEAKTNRDATQGMLGEAEAAVNSATARTQQARVQVAEAQLRLDRMTVRAPVDGRVLQLIAAPGTTLPGTQGLLKEIDDNTVVTLYQPKKLQVRADVRFEDLPRVTLHQKVSLENPALPASITGRVLFVTSEANIQKNTLAVKVAIDDPPPVLKPEMLMDVTFLAVKPPDEKTASTTELRLFIPKSLVATDDRGSYVWVADQSAGVIRRTPVETGQAGSDGLVEVTKGLNIASKLVAKGGEGLADGARIRVTGEEPPQSTGGHSQAQESQHQPLNRLPSGGK